MTGYVLALDQGTTSTRSIIFDHDFGIVASAQEEIQQHYPSPGWVEHEVEDLWLTSVRTMRAAMAKAGASAKDIAAIGITNQRETVVVWDRRTGQAIHKAIVWQDRRTAGACERMVAEGHEPVFATRTGLRLDPYFSGTKIGWILDHVEGARAKAEAGELAFGTVDSFLLWRLTGGKVHATDATNASRTLLYDIHRGRWDSDLCARLAVPMSVLPEVKDCAADFGTTVPDLLDGPVRIAGIAGDQQAATIGQACFRTGMMKSTYGTGCFALLNTGDRPVTSTNRLLSTIAYQLDGKRTYALEGAIFVAGAAVQWLRDGLKIISSAAESGSLAAASDPDQEVYLVPAFVGLGAPYWDANCRGAMFGLTRGTTERELARATLESIGYQTRDLISAMQGDWTGSADNVLRVDGGMVASGWSMQFLADILDAPVDRPKVMETTALGAAYLAGLQTGFFPDPETFAATWRLDRRFAPTMDAATRNRKYAGWQDAVSRTLSRKP